VVTDQVVTVCARRCPPTRRRGRGRCWPLVLLSVIGQASADCGGDFGGWLAGVRAEAEAAGLGGAALGQLETIRRNDKVLARDRSQRVFTQDWATFSGRMVNAHRLKAGAARLKSRAETFAAAENAYGVPGVVVAAFWGLETDYGAVQGDFRTLDALATLAHDCRRPELFRPQLLAALRLVDVGWLVPAELTGAWAGELGQLQLLPRDYLERGIDGDGDGRVDLRRGEADVIFTGARLLRDFGWRAGEPWLMEVRLPESLPWESASGRLPITRWQTWGLRGAAGEVLADTLPDAALLLPMGHQGPAFLAFANFDCFLNWNQSATYATTAAYFATRLAGAPPVNRGRPQPGLSFDEVKALQARLGTLGYDVGGVDGVLGARTREAVRAEQLRRGLPADGWPTPDLLARIAADPPRQ
jgi:lytic murein transglycosylase